MIESVKIHTEDQVCFWKRFEIQFITSSRERKLEVRISNLIQDAKNHVGTSG